MAAQPAYIVLAVEDELRAAAVGFDIPPGRLRLRRGVNDAGNHRHEFALGEGLFEHTAYRFGKVVQILDKHQLAAGIVADRNPLRWRAERKGAGRLDADVTQALGVDQHQPPPGVEAETE